jgi:hypothetical protein
MLKIVGIAKGAWEEVEPLQFKTALFHIKAQNALKKNAFL